jgi:hypothetical protein
MTLELDPAIEVAIERPDDWEEVQILLLPRTSAGEVEAEPEAMALARQIDDMFGPDLTDAFWDEDVTANRAIHQLMWQYGPIPWAEFSDTDAGRRGHYGYYAGAVIDVICKLGAVEFLRRVPAFRELALAEMSEALAADNLDSTPGGRPEGPMVAARLRLALFDEMDDKDDLDVAAEATHAALQCGVVNVARPSTERLRDLVHVVAERLDATDAQVDADELRWHLCVYCICPCDACTWTRARRVGKYRHGAPVEVQSFATSRFEIHRGFFGSLVQTRAFIDVNGELQAFDLHDTQVWDLGDTGV